MRHLDLCPWNYDISLWNLVCKLLFCPADGYSVSTLYLMIIYYVAFSRKWWLLLILHTWHYVLKNKNIDNCIFLTLIIFDCHILSWPPAYWLLLSVCTILSVTLSTLSAVSHHSVPYSLLPWAYCLLSLIILYHSLCYLEHVVCCLSSFCTILSVTFEHIVCCLSSFCTILSVTLSTLSAVSHQSVLSHSK